MGLKAHAYARTSVEEFSPHVRFSCILFLVAAKQAVAADARRPFYETSFCKHLKMNALCLEWRSN